MAEQATSSFDELSASQMELVDDICLRFESAWQKPSEPSLEGFLDNVTEPVRAVLYRELASIDTEYRHGKLWHWTQASKGPVRGGPFSWTELKTFALAGRLARQDLIRRKGMDEWARAGELAELFDRGPPPGSPGTERSGLLPVDEASQGERDPTYRQEFAADSATVQRVPGEPTAESPLWPNIPGYRIEGVLGRGAMGKVFVARQTNLGNRRVALKVIVSGQVAGPEEIARFRLEAASLASLNSPNIVQVYEVGEWFVGDGSATLPYFAMEYVEGGTLAQRLGKTPQYPREAARMMAVVARAVHDAHRRGIIHRDLKPGNILLGNAVQSRPPKEGAHVALDAFVPKISDFGLAKHMNDDAELTQTGRLLGTPSYMAPEQAIGKVRDIGPGTDVYALGTILYEMLTGRPPFTSAEEDDDTIPAILEQVRSQDPVSPRALVGRLSRDLETICLKCLEKEPARRYASALELAEDLERYCSNRPIRARPLTSLGWLWRWCRRNQAVAALAIGLLVFGSLSFAVMGVLLVRAEHLLDIANRQNNQANIQNERLLQITTFDPGPPREVGFEEFRAEGKMTQNGFLFRLNADKTYLIELRSSDGEPYLLVWDSTGKLIPTAPFVRKADWGGVARLRFQPPQDDVYRVTVVFRSTGQSDYVLSIRERGPNEKGRFGPPPR